MSGRFNPFQSRQQEVLRPHQVSDATKARKLLAKLQRKRPCVWVEISSLEAPPSVHQLHELDGATSAVVFLNQRPAVPLADPLPPVLDELIRRLWKNFNKLYLIQFGETELEGPAGDENG